MVTLRRSLSRFRLLFISCPIVGLVFLSACGGGSSSSSNTQPADQWSIPVSQVVDGGPGKDGIPAIDTPLYIAVQDATHVADHELVVGILVNGVPRAFPHSILNWHEVVNLETLGEFHTLSYCPLTGSADLWRVPESASDKTYGTSGLLYNSNLILYDRQTDSNWSQMLNQSVNGALINNQADKVVSLEMSWASWKLMYPDSLVLSEDTGFSRSYDIYPYGDYLTSATLLFQVANSDNRLHPKSRVLGIREGDFNKVYPIGEFDTGIQVISDSTGIDPVVIIGSREFGFAVAYSALAQDGTQLQFTAIESALPVVMQDNEGNQWDIFGQAVSGPRSGQRLTLASEFIAFWFAWVAFFPEPLIHEFD
jgi:hypothetical protein